MNGGYCKCFWKCNAKFDGLVVYFSLDLHYFIVRDFMLLPSQLNSDGSLGRRRFLGCCTISDRTWGVTCSMEIRGATKEW